MLIHKTCQIHGNHAHITLWKIRLLPAFPRFLTSLAQSYQGTTLGPFLKDTVKAFFNRCGRTEAT